MGETHDGGAQRSMMQKIIATLPYLLTAAAAALWGYCVARGSEPFNISLEDGFIEWGTVFFFALCALVAGCALRANRATLRKPEKWFLALFVVLMLLAIGEEISWGQRIFNWEVPEVISAENEGLIQAGHRDTAVHNLSFRSKYIRFSIGGVLFGPVLLIALGMHGIWLPLAHRKGDKLAVRLVDRFGVFVPAVKLGILVTVSATLFHFSKDFDGTDGREYKECLIPAIFTFMMLGVYFAGSRPIDKAMRGVVVGLIAVWLVGSVVLLQG